MNNLDSSHIVLKKQNHDLLKTCVNSKLSKEGEISKEFEKLAMATNELEPSKRNKDINQDVDKGEYQNKTKSGLIFTRSVGRLVSIDCKSGFLIKVFLQVVQVRPLLP